MKNFCEIFCQLILEISNRLKVKNLKFITYFIRVNHKLVLIILSHMQFHPYIFQILQIGPYKFSKNCKLVTKNIQNLQIDLCFNFEIALF